MKRSKLFEGLFTDLKEKKDVMVLTTQDKLWHYNKMLEQYNLVYSIEPVPTMLLNAANLFENLMPDLYKLPLLQSVKKSCLVMMMTPEEIALWSLNVQAMLLEISTVQKQYKPKNRSLVDASKVKDVFKRMTNR